ncbi:lipase 3-like [Anopheles marshallii]|uniref:lipase 3-like n=1 Tax=Anopheles marshallii TaxID=1521116 RepID=UPI00237C3715|nr:lipase 3-like [Anopheles marshallii]
MAGSVTLTLILTLTIFTVQVLCAMKPAEVLRHSITRHGYPVELHKVTTQDGYILSLVRIPGKSDKPPVLIMHGLLSSSVDWTVQGPDKSISFLASDEGYDVWLGNVRGNTFSKEHKTHSSKDREFWRFSFHEIGLYDLPAMVDYIRGNTSSDTIHYVGHSQGGTAFLVMASMRPAYNRKFASVHLMAPAAYIYHATSPAFDFARRIDELEMFAKLTRSYEIGGRGPGSSVELVYAGHKTGLVPTSLVLTNIWYLVGVHDSINRTVLGEILANTPAGCSVYQLLHYAQNYLAKSFQLYDYGPAGNVQRYGSKVPPEYPLHNVTAPIMLYYSAGDNFVPAEDVEELADQLPNVVHKHRIGLRKWNHIDYLFDASAHRLYRMIVASLRNQSVDENSRK